MAMGIESKFLTWPTLRGHINVGSNSCSVFTSLGPAVFTWDLQPNLTVLIWKATPLANRHCILVRIVPLANLHPEPSFQALLLFPTSPLPSLPLLCLLLACPSRLTSSIPFSWKPAPVLPGPQGLLCIPFVFSSLPALTFQGVSLLLPIPSWLSRDRFSEVGSQVKWYLYFEFRYPGPDCAHERSINFHSHKDWIKWLYFPQPH